MRKAIVRTFVGLLAPAWAPTRATVRVLAPVTILATTLTAGLLSACAPLSEDQKYERAERLTLAREAYAVREEQCINMGGVMHLQKRPLEKPSPMDYRAARCVRR